MRFAVVAWIVAFLLLGPSAALAQVPPHSPGTVCLTPTFWCWAQIPGPLGAPCVCASGGGVVQGVLG